MNTAILWDIENVTPPAGSNYAQSIVDTIAKNGKVSYAMAFGDWSKQSKTLAADLSANSFELIHVLHSRNIKDSSDMSMVAHGVELIFQYPHIERYVLITGDADFRPLLQSLRKYGKETLIICNVLNASEDLLKMADDFLDYRDIIDNDDDDDDSDQTSAAHSTVPKEDKQTLTRRAFELLEEALYSMQDEKKSPHLGALKIKMKLLNPQFDETKLGFSTWKSFAKAAEKAGFVAFDSENNDILKAGEKAKRTLPEVFAALIKVLPPSSSGKWMTFNEAGKHINLRDYGYRQFKKLAIDAEKRGLVELDNSDRTWKIRVSQVQK